MAEAVGGGVVVLLLPPPPQADKRATGMAANAKSFFMDSILCDVCEYLVHR
jgi:hypothetical protein